MKCPHCQDSIDSQYQGKQCPECGEGIQFTQVELDILCALAKLDAAISKQYPESEIAKKIDQLYTLHAELMGIERISFQ